MVNNFPGGVWPVMITPFTEDNQVDYNALEQLVEWYIKEGVSGLFAVCQSSEMFYLTLDERVNIASFIKEKSAGRVPIIASGHISDSLEDQIKELNEIAKTGVDAIILITNRLAREDESDELWLENLNKILAELPDSMPLGFYECPYPYKRLLSPEMAKYSANTGRFFFLKDTSCDINDIKVKLEVTKGTNLKIYNANTATLLESLRIGVEGYSGVMANMQCSLYVKLCKDFKNDNMNSLSDNLTICALIENQIYPINAKYYLSEVEGLDMKLNSRTKSYKGMTNTHKKEVKMLARITEELENKYL